MKSKLLIQKVQKVVHVKFAQEDTEEKIEVRKIKNICKKIYVRRSRRRRNKKRLKSRKQ